MSATPHNLTLEFLQNTLDSALTPFVKVWPLQNFIACNPLVALENQPFEKSLELASERLQTRAFLNPALFIPFYAKNPLALTALQKRFEKCFGEHTEASWLAAEFSAMITPESLNTNPPEETVLEISRILEPLFTEEVEQQLATELAPVNAKTMTLSAWLDRLTTGNHQALIDRQMIKWCAAYLDQGQATWSMPGKTRSFFSAWFNLAQYDNLENRQAQKFFQSLLKSLPTNSQDACLVLIQRLGIETEALQDYFSDHLSRLPGWVGYMCMKSADATQDERVANLLMDYLTIRLCYEWAYTSATCQKQFGIKANQNDWREYWHSHPDDYATRICQSLFTSLNLAEKLQNKSFNSIKHKTLKALTKTKAQDYAQRLARASQRLGYDPAKTQFWIQANGKALISALSEFSPQKQSLLLMEGLEDAYADSLMEKLKAAKQTNPPHNPAEAPLLAQAVFCIDVRSEPYRRALEATSHIETRGFAGFFGIPARIYPLEHQRALDCCPAIVKPLHAFKEVISQPDSALTGQLKTQQAVSSTRSLLGDIKKQAASTFGYVEAFGLFHAFSMIARTLNPLGWAKYQSLGKIGTGETQFVSVSNAGNLTAGLSITEQTQYAATLLKLMGLNSPFQRFIVICGHGSQTLNNPYASALDCGACGGNHGSHSAKLLVQILNTKPVREALREQDIHIPDTTWFIAAEHNTVTDEVLFLNTTNLPSELHSDFQQLQNIFSQATRVNRKNREEKLTMGQAFCAKKAAVDWSQTRPEWGLAGNASFIIAPRSLTRNMDLEGRAFLNSYDFSCDPDGQMLESILGGPVAVGGWINTQYLFSTLDNTRFGSGSKVFHNPVGHLGVMVGNAGDLQMGLPMQSVMHTEGIPFHMPVRLSVVIRAPLTLITKTLKRLPQILQLFENGWMTLLAWDPSDDKFYRYETGKGFEASIQQNYNQASTTPTLVEAIFWAPQNTEIDQFQIH